MLGQTLFSQLFQLNVGKILSFCWKNSCVAPEFHQSHLQCTESFVPLLSDFTLADPSVFAWVHGASFAAGDPDLVGHEGWRYPLYVSADLQLTDAT